MKRLPVLLTLTLAWAAPASAGPIAITNASFEAPVTASATFGFAGTPGWVVSSPFGLGVMNPTSTAPGGPYYTGPGTTDGTQAAYGFGGSFNQVLPVVLTAGMFYEFSVDVGNPKNSIFPGYAFGLYTGTTLLAEVTSSVPNDGYATKTVTYLALDGDPSLGLALTLKLTALGRSAGMLHFDNVVGSVTPQQATTVVPEPATLALLGFGLALAVRRLRRHVG